MLKAMFMSLLVILTALTQCFDSFQYYPARTVPSSWFQDSSKYLQPISSDDGQEYPEQSEDLDIAASEFNNEHIDRVATDLKRMGGGHVMEATGDNQPGRVQIKVYRGPNSGSLHEPFAPYGYWIKQPADYDHK